MTKRNWTRRAACRGADSRLFFGDDNDPDEPFSTADAALMAEIYCTECPVRFLCAEAGEKEPYGVWGGTLPKDRGFADGPH